MFNILTESDRAVISEYLPVPVSAYPGEMKNITPKKEVSAAVKKQAIIDIPKRIRDFILSCKRTASKKSVLSTEMNTQFRLVNFKDQVNKLSFGICKIEEKDDGSYYVEIEENSEPGKFNNKGFLSFYNGKDFGTYVHVVSEFLSVRLKFTPYTPSSIKRYIEVCFMLTIPLEEVRELCAGEMDVVDFRDSDIEEFKVASAMSTLCNTKLEKMFTYANPKSKSRKGTAQTDIVVRQSNGHMLFLPKTDYRRQVEKDMRNSYDPETNTFLKEKVELPPVIVYWNMDTGMLTYTGSSGTLTALSLSGSVILGKMAGYTVLNSNFDFVMDTFNTSGSDAVWNAISEGFDRYAEMEVNDGAGIVVEHSKNPIIDAIDRMAGMSMPSDMMDYLNSETVFNTVKGGGKTLLVHAIKWQRSPMGKEDIKNPLRRFSIVAVLMMMEEYFGKMEEIQDEIEKRIERMENATKADIPSFPDNLAMDDLQFWPHQAEAEAKLDIAEHLAVLDVATGGGKTLILLADVLNCLNKGAVTKVLGIVPTNLLSNWYDEIMAFSDGTMNCVVLATATANQWSLPALMEIVNNAPPNTIFLTSYSWLKSGATKEKLGKSSVRTFPIVEQLKSAAEWDFVFIDESHMIKDMSTQIHHAVMAMGQGVPYKRIATGTFAPNNPSDIVGQMAFLDPTIFKDVTAFKKKYNYDNEPSWEKKKQVLDQCKQDIKSIGLVSYTRKDWFHKLPKINEKFHVCELTYNQRRIYNAIIDTWMEGMVPGTKEYTAWMEMQSDPDKEMPEILLAKYGRLNAFSIDPAGDDHGDEMLEGDDRISPKVRIVTELLDKHFAETPDDKVLIFMQNIKPHDYIYDSLPPKYKAMAIKFRGGQNDKLERFKTDPRIKIMVAADGALKVGHNLQMASRMIRLDVHWSPGDLDQVLARIYRPSKKYNRDHITIDWILCDQTADVLKMRRTLRKMMLNAAITGIIDVEDVPILPPITANEEALKDGSNWSDVEQMEVPHYRHYREIEGEKWDVLKATKGMDDVTPTLSGSLGKDIIDAPWPEGMTVKGEGVTSVKDMLLDFGGLTTEVSEDPDASVVGEEISEKDRIKLDAALLKLKGRRCLTEFGEGVIIYAKESKGKYLIRVRLDGDSTNRTFKGSVVGVLEGVDQDVVDGLDVAVDGVSVVINNVKCYLTEKGSLYKLTKAGKLGKNPIAVYSSVTKKMVKPNGKKFNLEPADESILRDALKEYGFVLGTKVKPPKPPKDDAPKDDTPDDDGAPKGRPLKAKFNKKSHLIYANGDIFLSDTKGKPAKKLYSAVKGKWCDIGKTTETQKMTTKVKTALVGMMKKSFNVDLKDLGKVKPEPKPAPPSGEFKVKNFKLKGKRYALTSESEVRPISESSGKLLKPISFFIDGLWMARDKVTEFKFTAARKAWLADNLGKMLGVDLTDLAPEPVDTEDQLAVKLEALAMYGNPFLSLQYNGKDKKAIKDVFKGLRFTEQNFYRLKLTPAKVNNLKKALVNGTFKPANKKMILKHLDNFLKPKEAIKNLRPVDITTFRVTFERNLDNKTCSLIPVIFDKHIELWISARNANVLSKHKSEINRLKFVPAAMLVRTFKTYATAASSADKLYARAEKANVNIKNSEDFKSQLVKIKTYL